MTRITAKPRKQKQVDALARRENNLANYKAGQLGTLNVPEGMGQNEFLKGKIAIAEAEIATLKKLLGKT